MEFKMLSSQINPHFLYNTLETIRMRSIKAGNREVANGVKLLGKSMRYVLDNTATASTTLDKELDYIETYLAIQKLRFHDKINYSLKYPLDMDLSTYHILPCFCSLWWRMPLSTVWKRWKRTAGLFFILKKRKVSCTLKSLTTAAA